MATASQIVCLVCEGSDSINSMLLARDFQQRMGKQPQQRGLYGLGSRVQAGIHWISLDNRQSSAMHGGWSAAITSGIIED